MHNASHAQAAAAFACTHTFGLAGGMAVVFSLETHGSELTAL